MITTTRITTAFITNPARDYPEDFQFAASGKSNVFAFKRGGAIADVIVFGFVARSNISRGKTYERQGRTLLFKNIEIILIEEEGERLLAMLSMVSALGPLQLATSQQGAVTFSTRHTVVDEYGNDLEGTLPVLDI